MRGQIDVSALIVLSLTTFLFLWLAMPAIQTGVDIPLGGADTLSKALLYFIPTMFLIGALFWTNSFIKSKYGGV